MIGNSSFVFTDIQIVVPEYITDVHYTSKNVEESYNKSRLIIKTSQTEKMVQNHQIVYQKTKCYKYALYNLGVHITVVGDQSLNIVKNNI